MRNRNKRRQKNRINREGDNNHYWMSYSDLMSALLLIFALLLMINIMSNQSEIEAKDQMIEEVLGIKTRIIEELSQTFKDSNLEMEIDDQTGAIRFSSGVFFDYDSSIVLKEGKSNLEAFVPQYIEILLSEEFKEHVAEIIIEGHTDEAGSYLYNLELSQNRAFSVVEEIFSEDFPDFQEREDLRYLITSNGRSFTVPIYNSKNKIDDERSRRVEFKFRLNDEEVIKQIQDLMDKHE